MPDQEEIWQETDTQSQLIENKNIFGAKGETRTLTGYPTGT